MSVVTPIEPTVAQAAAIRQAGAQQNVSTGITTEISQNPQEATSAYEALQQGQAAPAGTPGTYAPVIQQPVQRTTPTASLSRFNQANQGGFTFRTTTPTNTTPGTLSRFNQANSLPTTSTSFYEVSLPGGRVASIGGKPIIFPTQGAAQDYINAIGSGGNPFQIPKQGPPRPFIQPPSFLQTLEGPLFSKSAIENTPLIGTLVKGGEVGINALGTFFRQSSQGYQQLGSNIQGADQPGFARFLQGEAYVGAGFTNLFALSFGKPNTGLQQTGPAIVGEGLGVGTSAYLLSLVPLPGVAGAGRVAGAALRFGYGSLFGGVSSAVQGGSPFEGALFGGATFAIAPEAIGLAKPLLSRAGSFLGSEIRSGADVAYERIFLRTGLTKPSIASDADFLTTMGNIYREQNYAQTARDIYSQVGRGVNAYTYNPPEYRSFNEPIKNPYENFGDQVSTEDINKALGLSKGEVRPSSDLYSSNVSKEGTVTLQRTKQITEEVQLQQQEFVQKSQQEYFQGLALLPKTRARLKQQDQLQFYQYPETSLKPQQDLFSIPKQSQREVVGFSLAFVPGQAQAFKQQYQFSDVAVAQAQKTELAQKDLQVSKQQFRQLFEVQQESQSKSLFPRTTRKQKRKKKGRRNRKSYREFGNILNLRQFEF